MIRNTNQIISTFRGTMKVETLRRINTVCGTEFPVSGDAPLRQAWETRVRNDKDLSETGAYEAPC